MCKGLLKSLTLYDTDYAFYLNEVKKRLNLKINSPCEKFTLDHISPIKGRHTCGLHTWNNLHLIPRKSNLIKSNKLDLEAERQYLLNFTPSMLPKIPLYKEIKPKKTPELDASKKYQEFLSKQGIEFRTEVETECGYADIVTDNCVIEVKEYKSWKHAIGQVLVYSYLLNKEEKEIYLFGNIDYGKIHLIQSICNKFNVTIKTADIL